MACTVRSSIRIVLVCLLAATANIMASDPASSEIKGEIAEILKNYDETLTNEAVFSICTVMQLDDDITVGALEGFVVDIEFLVDSYSSYHQLLHGSYQERIGAVVDVVYVAVSASSNVVPIEMRKDSRIRVLGVVSEGDNFRNNASDGCYLRVDATSITVTGF